MHKQNEKALSSKDTKRVNPDQECWVKDRIRDAIRMAVALRENKGVQANEYAYNMALNGIVEGQAIEIIKSLNLEPSYVNLRPEQDFISPLGHVGRSFIQPVSPVIEK